MDNRPIGMFDSGVGGMTVLKEVKKKLPNESFVYFGDNKRFPYGSKSKEAIIELTKNGIDFLIRQNVKLIVIACGTATSQALEEVKRIYKIPIIGVIEPTVQYMEKQNYKKVGVIATAGTIRSKGWEEAIHKEIPNVEIQSKACPLLASMVEEGWTDNQIAKLVVNEYIKDLKNIDALVLGCTHYPLLENTIKEQLGKKTETLNTGKFVAMKVEELLKESQMQNEEKKEEDKIFLTDMTTHFNEIASRLFGEEIKPLQAQERE